MDGKRSVTVQRSLARRILRWFRIVFAASCVCSLAGSLGFAFRTEIFRYSSFKATGEVVRLEERENEDNAVEYAPVFQFWVADGKEYTLSSRVATRPAAFFVGEKVAILYRSSDPEKAQIDSFWELWFESMILLLIGLAHGVIAGVIFRVERRLGRAAAAVKLV